MAKFRQRIPWRIIHQQLDGAVTTGRFIMWSDDTSGLNLCENDDVLWLTTGIYLLKMRNRIRLHQQKQLVYDSTQIRPLTQKAHAHVAPPPDKMLQSRHYDASERWVEIKLKNCRCMTIKLRTWDRTPVPKSLQNIRYSFRREVGHEMN